jgi:hypothetical protein
LKFGPETSGLKDWGLPKAINQKSHPQKWKAFHWSNY